MTLSITAAGWLHATLAAVGVIAGAVQLMRSKGDHVHRAVGYAYVYAMIASDATAMLLTRFTGTFNVFHAGAIANFVCIVAAMVPLLRQQRQAGWLATHYRWITGSYIGLIAAAATELSVRVLPITGRGQAWLAAAVATVIVTVLGSILIRRNHPRASGAGF